jgi:hypothetical protein
MNNDSIYENSAVPFIYELIYLGVPLSAINTNDWHCSKILRVYVTREYGRNNGGDSRKTHVLHLGNRSAKRLSEFYLKN